MGHYAYLVAAILVISVVWAICSLCTHYALTDVVADLGEGGCENDRVWHVFLSALVASFLLEVAGAYLMTWLGTSGGAWDTANTVYFGAYYVLKFALIVAVAYCRYWLREAPLRQFVWLVSSPPVIFLFLAVRAACVWTAAHRRL